MSLIGELAEVDAIETVKPITEAQWERILDGRKFRILVKAEQQEWAGKNAVRCINCKRAGSASGSHDPWRAFCLTHKCMVSNNFPVLCREFTPN